MILNHLQGEVVLDLSLVVCWNAVSCRSFPLNGGPIRIELRGPLVRVKLARF